MDELHEKQQEIIHVLREENQTTPERIREKTTLTSPQNTHHHLQQLRANGYVERIGHALYTLDNDASQTTAGDDG